MENTLKTSELIQVIVAAALLACTASALSADLVFRNGDVYTVDAARRWVSAVAVTGNKIVYVGGEQGVDAHIDADTKIIDLQGRMLLPGFHDSHVHPLGGGASLGSLRLDGVYDREEVFHRIRTYADANPDLDWVIGGGWIEAPFLPGGVPDRHMLDRLVPDRPAFLRNASGHQAWANSKALEIAGITADTEDPANGRIDREPSGEPSGSRHSMSKPQCRRR